jgi:hypothetical protein
MRIRGVLVRAIIINAKNNRTQVCLLNNSVCGIFVFSNIDLNQGRE